MLSRAKLVALVIAGWSLVGSTLVFASSVETTKIGSKDAETLRSLFKDLIEAKTAMILKRCGHFSLPLQIRFSYPKPNRSPKVTGDPIGARNKSWATSRAYIKVCFASIRIIRA